MKNMKKLKSKRKNIIKIKLPLILKRQKKKNKIRFKRNPKKKQNLKNIKLRNLLKFMNMNKKKNPKIYRNNK